MGYTHYWTFKPVKRGETAKVERLYKKTLKECAKIARYYQDNFIEYDSERLSGYTVHDKTNKYGGLKINGKGDNAHEDFTMREHFKQNFNDFGGGFQFCKTARKPYDLVVTACLALLKHRLKDYIDVSSDGTHNEWKYGIALIKEAIDVTVKNPIPNEESSNRCNECGNII